jgi:hypothetical protein
MNEQILAAYQKAMNKIEDKTEYNTPRPYWLACILSDLEKELKEIKNGTAK